MQGLTSAQLDEKMRILQEERRRRIAKHKNFTQLRERYCMYIIYSFISCFNHTSILPSTYLPPSLPPSLPTSLPPYLPPYLPTSLPTYLPPYLPPYLPTPLPPYLPPSLPTSLPTYTPPYLPTSLPTSLLTYIPPSILMLCRLASEVDNIIQTSSPVGLTHNVTTEEPGLQSLEEQFDRRQKGLPTSAEKKSRQPLKQQQQGGKPPRSPSPGTYMSVCT